MTYKTKQKEDIIKVIKSQKGEFLVKDGYSSGKGKIGLSTIYCMIDRWVLEGVLKKSIGANNVTYYQYLEKCLEKNHFYLKCLGCGEVIHVDCDCIQNFMEHTYLHHQFTLDTNSIILSGFCLKCQGRR